MFALGNGNGRGVGVDEKAMDFEDGGRGVGLAFGEDNKELQELLEKPVVENVCDSGVWGGGKDEVVSIFVDEGVRGSVRGGGGGEWLGADVSGDVASDMLENPWCLGFAKEGCGEVVEGFAPANDYVWGHGDV